MKCQAISSSLKVLLYAYATGVFSSRGIARRLEEDVAFRVLAAGNFPQHRTVCEFRRRHLEDFKALFVEVVRLAREFGLARFGKLSIDGTKVRTNASDQGGLPLLLDEVAETVGEQPDGVLSEAPHGWIKHVLGFRRFSLRGLAKVRGEWDLVCLALNAKRLHALIAA